ncbi:hypothetical protein C8F04DRAFT_1270022 [Mycena alexandri]|uniref:Alpha-type protein kinase domain-containing protein n=1 Tax=Mycena alexandri TaxID=1745969 RepID=A0AAD6SCB9_9AGAR|nr:hypothetical protein C8F04DRAFT_1270022 [Mycena alexandri]
MSVKKKWVSIFDHRSSVVPTGRYCRHDKQLEKKYDSELFIVNYHGKIVSLIILGVIHHLHVLLRLNIPHISVILDVLAVLHISFILTCSLDPSLDPQQPGCLSLQLQRPFFATKPLLKTLAPYSEFHIGFQSTLLALAFRLLENNENCFVGDYQGGNTLLTDPQIMSSPEFMAAGHHLFADGNVATGFESFEIDHVCNKFCQFFQLRTDYNNWNVEDDASGGFTKAMSISVGI